MGVDSVASPPDLRRHADTQALLRAHGASLRAVARRHSICTDDAEDALQRALVICLTRSPACEGDGLIRWMHVVTRNEARAVRAARLRTLGFVSIDDVEGACPRPGPQERVESAERARHVAAALARLRDDERRAIGLQAVGLSYEEIGARCEWTYTKVNRSVAEGRARLRSLMTLEEPFPQPGDFVPKSE